MPLKHNNIQIMEGALPECVQVRAVALGGVNGVVAAASSLLDVFVEQASKTPYALASAALLIWLAPGSGLAV